MNISKTGHSRGVMVCRLFFSVHRQSSKLTGGEHHRQAGAHGAAQNSGICRPGGHASMVLAKRQAWTHQLSKGKMNKALCGISPSLCL